MSHNNPYARRERGFALIVVMIAVAVAVVIVLTFEADQSTTRGIANNVENHRQARNIAESAIDIAVAHVRHTPDWRQTLTCGTWVADQDFDGGAFTLSCYDHDDDLADDPFDPLSLTAVGSYGNVTYTVRARLEPYRRVLVIVGDIASLTSGEQARLALLDQWGWQAMTLSDDASQEEYDQKVPLVTAVLISSDASASAINTKLRDAHVGIVCEVPGLVDDMGLSSSGPSTSLGNLINILGGGHPITQPFGSGLLSILNLLAPVTTYGGTLAPGVDVLAQHTLTGRPTMLAIDAGADDFGDRFVIDGGQVVPQLPYAARITVIGAAIQSGSYQVPVTVRIGVSDQTFDPFGPFTLGISGNVNDDANPREYVLPNVFAAGTPVSVTARSWNKINNQVPGTADDQVAPLMTVASSDDSPYVMVLRNGDAVPDIHGFNNQSSIEDFIEPYLSDDLATVALPDNQAIYLFELGTTDLNNPAADFQDLVLLVSLAHNPMGFGSGGNAAGRRVFMPWGGGLFNPDSLTSDGETLLQRSIDWAGGGQAGGLSVQWLAD